MLWKRLCSRYLLCTGCSRLPGPGGGHSVVIAPALETGKGRVGTDRSVPPARGPDAAGASPGASVLTR